LRAVVDAAFQPLTLVVLAGDQVPSRMPQLHRTPPERDQLLLEFGAQAGYSQHQSRLAARPANSRSSTGVSC